MTHFAPHRLALSFAALALLVACSKPESAAPSGAVKLPTAASAPTATAKEHAIACAMVLQEAMSAIVGGAVIAKPNDRSNGQTQCIYSAASGSSP